MHVIFIAYFTYFASSLFTVGHDPFTVLCTFVIITSVNGCDLLKFVYHSISTDLDIMTVSVSVYHSISTDLDIMAVSVSVKTCIS